MDNGNKMTFSSLGASFIQDKTKEYISENQGFISDKFKALYPFFDISNDMLRDKLLLIVYPFKYTNNTLYKPDLYIPLVFLAFYVVVQSLSCFFQKKFNPDDIFITFSKNLTLITLEAILLKIFTYFLKFPLFFLDSICFVGYKYVSMSLLLAIKLLYSGIFYYCAYLYFNVVFFIFLSRSLNYYMQPMNIQNFIEKRKLLLIAISLESILLLIKTY